MRKVILGGFLLVVLMVFLLPGSVVFEAWSAGDGGTISGVVKFKGAAPAPRKLDITKDKEVCAKQHLYDESLVVDKNSSGVRWVVVSVLGAKAQAPKAAPELVMDNKACEFTPHVLLVPVGSSLKVFNSDGILHNTHLTPTEKKNVDENKALPAFLTKQKKPAVFGERYFQKPENIKVTCDVHSWMTGWIVVTDSLAAVTDKGGGFKLTDVPPGTYTVEVWHETLGRQSQKVTVKAKEEVKVAFELAKK